MSKHAPEFSITPERAFVDRTEITQFRGCYLTFSGLVQLIDCPKKPEIGGICALGDIFCPPCSGWFAAFFSRCGFIHQSIFSRSAFCLSSHSWHPFYPKRGKAPCPILLLPKNVMVNMFSVKICKNSNRSVLLYLKSPSGYLHYCFFSFYFFLHRHRQVRTAFE